MTPTTPNVCGCATCTCKAVDGGTDTLDTCELTEGDRLTLVVGAKIVFLEVVKIRERDFPTQGKLPADPAVVGVVCTDA